ncbi:MULTISPECIES: monovalent cation/H+ antiporter complex subunit F [Dietzia]|uniref:Monovalent cation/H+ antiporter complex subunit F n=1 Tax=Dietzia cinnamea TaxID=321318 RepID=A0A4R3ZTC3_9ACTN|nr:MULTISPECIES: monovalent cation/H+ antiporter complex subunit F [Dietzia]KZO58939.1 transporter [Dietzia maris]AVM64419.1 transporter [Dietzia sp. oral taxon 368]MBM7230086.1 pesticidal protein Cry26Aa [Dietzia cinnamea]MCT1639774.1 monovalent cation/H+ antiporter complex subunit F [Dietzia cinnamea]MCT1712246.1 monovalent cation/H+ antiporter complex subunit F [Dietzia cinnamea]
MSPLLTVLLGASTVIVVASMVVAAVRAVRGPGDANRAVMADLSYFCAVALFVLFVIRQGSAVALDVVMLGSLIGILSTVALARLLSRGQR